MREFSLQVCTSQANFWPCNTQRDLKHFTRIKASDGCFRGVFWGRFSRRTLELTLLLKLLLHPVHFRCEMPHKVRLQTSKAWVSWRIFTVSFRWSHFPLGPGKSHSLVEVLAKWKCELAEAQRDAGKQTSNASAQCSAQIENKWHRPCTELFSLVFVRFLCLSHSVCEFKRVFLARFSLSTFFGTFPLSAFYRKLNGKYSRAKFLNMCVALVWQNILKLAKTLNLKFR